MFQIWFARTVCGCRQSCVFQIFSEILQPHRKICQRVVRIFLVIPLFILVLDFWDCTSLLDASSSTSLLHWTWRWTWSRSHQFPGCLFCLYGDVEDELLPRLVDNPGTTRGTKLSVSQIILFPSLVNRGFWPLTHSWEYPWSSQSLPSDRTAGVSSRNCTVTNRFLSWTNTCASSWVCTSSLAVNTTVGVLDLVTVSISSELNSFLLIMCIDAPESTTNSRSSGLVEVGAGITFASREYRTWFCPNSWACNYFRQTPRCFAGASFLVQGLLMWSFPEFWRARTTLMRRTLLDNSSRWVLSLTACFDPNIPGSRWKDFLG